MPEGRRATGSLGAEPVPAPSRRPAGGGPLERAPSSGSDPDEIFVFLPGSNPCFDSPSVVDEELKRDPVPGALPRRAQAARAESQLQSMPDTVRLEQAAAKGLVYRAACSSAEPHVGSLSARFLTRVFEGSGSTRALETSAGGDATRAKPELAAAVRRSLPALHARMVDAGIDDARMGGRMAGSAARSPARSRPRSPPLRGCAYRCAGSLIWPPIYSRTRIAKKR